MTYNFAYIPSHADGTMERDDNRVAQSDLDLNCPCGYRAPHNSQKCEFNPNNDNYFLKVAQIEESELRVLDGNR